MISLSKYNAHAEPIFKKLKLLKLEDMLKLNEVKFYYKYKNHPLPSYFQQNHPNTNNTLREENTDHSFCSSFVLHLNTSIHSHNTR